MKSLLGEAPTALAYPYGFCSELSERVLADEGIEITFTTQGKTNTLIKGMGPKPEAAGPPLYAGKRHRPRPPGPAGGLNLQARGRVAAQDKSRHRSFHSLSTAIGQSDGAGVAPLASRVVARLRSRSPV